MKPSQYNQPPQHWQPTPQPPAPPTPPPKQRFRWELFVALPLTLSAIAWLFRNADLAFTWSQIMDLLTVNNRDRYTKLAILGVLACCVCAIVRVLRNSTNKDG